MGQGTTANASELQSRHHQSHERCTCCQMAQAQVVELDRIFHSKSCRALQSCTPSKASQTLLTHMEPSMLGRRMHCWYLSSFPRRFQNHHLGFVFYIYVAGFVCVCLCVYVVVVLMCFFSSKDVYIVKLTTYIHWYIKPVWVVVIVIDLKFN